MTDFTKQELLDLKPCPKWVSIINNWPDNPIEDRVIKTTIEANQDSAEFNLVQIMARSPKMATAMLDLGIDIDIQDAKGRTALFCAVSNKVVESVRVLIERGADDKIQTKDKQTPATRAVLRKNADILTILAKKPVSGGLVKE
ncbi:MAG: ankyrin repeat domain-containing protein [FCB group bacterium]|nr:ankyrin repeat domain-containing protein [FCB group bacterium]